MRVIRSIESNGSRLNSHDFAIPLSMWRMLTSKESRNQ